MLIQPRTFNLRKTLTVLAVLSVALYFYYQRPPPLQFWKISGAKWSSYSVKFTDNRLTKIDVQELERSISAKLDGINQQMSTYITDSEINRFNQSDSLLPQPVSPELAEVARTAMYICDQTGGAFNPTLDHLINVWGFGPMGPQKEPTEQEISEALALVGCNIIDVLQDNQLQKSVAAARLNLNAIAEGWAVDEVARILEGKGITNYFVEIGGEVYSRGKSEKMRPWRVGIDRPVDDAIPGELYDLVVELDGRGLATSGNYRNFVMNEEGRKVSHILDPRTGRPASSRTASVSVIAPDCATADALATALFVMGTEEGSAWMDGQTNIAAAFMEFSDDGSLVTTFSGGFEKFLLPKAK